eukprot:TRINITY_DN578_c0_g1_i2.p1 TRINITY_DN578_c0_g1~~TRINITY_DN578_c0_g1_i2.p1  ORF type:complete len:185 (+),score=86.39 TRINITY_DN578_c0_g1_i2:123-677(+)
MKVLIFLFAFLAAAFCQAPIAYSDALMMALQASSDFVGAYNQMPVNSSTIQNVWQKWIAPSSNSYYYPVVNGDTATPVPGALDLNNTISFFAGLGTFTYTETAPTVSIVDARSFYSVHNAVVSTWGSLFFHRFFALQPTGGYKITVYTEYDYALPTTAAPTTTLPPTTAAATTTAATTTTTVPP